MFTLNCKGKILKIDRPLVMGIINVTPDSFYEGHLSSFGDEILGLAKKMIAEGAAILDIGGQSTRPGSERISAEEEIKRVVPVIKNIRNAFPGILISADTYHSAVAAAAVDAGADIINDISAGEMDAAMISTVASLKVPYICMHMKGRPENMHIDPVYDDVVKEVLDFFIAKTGECKKAGIHDVIIDPGFGFGKTITHNFKLLQQLAVFNILGKPVLAGLSRKSTIYKTLNITPAEALNGTTVLNTLAINNGAHILRVHDVKEAKEVITLMNAYKKPLPG
ncbi:MAG: dihydropteroate synthase [Ferruginibacter sp.]